MAAPRSDSAWPSPDYVTPSPRSLSIIITNILLSVLATVVVFIRLFTRSKLLRSVGIDDWLILIGLGLAWGLALWNSVGTAWGLGRHVWDVPEDYWQGVGKIIWGTTSLYFPTLGFIKLSILFSLRRITPSAFGRNFIYYTMAVIIILTLGVTFANAFQCKPFSKVYAFNPGYSWVEWGDDQPGKCLNRPALFYTSSALNVLGDLVIWGIPMPMLFGLGWPWRQKLALVGVFSFGGVACIASVARIGILRELLYSPDLTWVIHKYSITSCLEVSLGIICASIPSLKPFVAKYFPSLLGRDSSHEHGSNRWSLPSDIVQQGGRRNYNAVSNEDETAIGGPGKGGRLGTGRLSWYSEQVLKAEEDARRYQAQQEKEDAVRRKLKLKKQQNDALGVGGSNVKRSRTWKSITSTISRSATRISKSATWRTGRSSISNDSSSGGADLPMERQVDNLAVPPLPPLSTQNVSDSYSIGISPTTLQPPTNNLLSPDSAATYTPSTITTPPPSIQNQNQKLKSLPFKLTIDPAFSSSLTRSPRSPFKSQYQALPDSDPDPDQPQLQTSTDPREIAPSPRTPRTPLQRIGSWGKSKYREFRGDVKPVPENTSDGKGRRRYDELQSDEEDESEGDDARMYNEKDKGDEEKIKNISGSSSSEPPPSTSSTQQIQPVQPAPIPVPPSPLQFTVGFRLDGPPSSDFAYY